MDVDNPELSSTELPVLTKYVFVCQNRTCLKQGAIAVLAGFEAKATSAFVVIGSGCLGQCGNGPMVRILPDDVWYWRVRPEEVLAVVERHLLGGKPVEAMRYSQVCSMVRQLE
ncbi:MAG: (2Fe-2S) ferredoxin domain-containing protein [Leptolyngbyaceae cyanobacterium RU_5_1]|nr:(2Fe-2S) ferredoxin domain-containing protein [Leptolyngbyaceae cyanobacterium RU_5_1]